MARRRRSAAAGLLVFLLLGAVLVVALYVGDRYVQNRAEREAAAQLQSQLGTPGTPVIDIEGWPFLTQVAGQNLRSVRVVADDVGAEGGSTVPVAHTDLVLTDVRSTDWFQSMTATTAQGTALLEYSALNSLSSVPLTYAGDGRLRVERSTAVFGVEVVARITGTPRLDVRAQTLTLADPEIEVGKVDIPESTADALLRVLLQPIPVEGLPFGLSLSSVTAEDDGLHVGLEGTDVELSR